MGKLLKEKRPPSDLFWPEVPALLWSKPSTTSFLCPSPDVSSQVLFNFPAVSLRALSARQVLKAEVSFSYT